MLTKLKWPDQISPQTWEQASLRVWSPVWSQVMDQVWDPVFTQVRRQDMDQVLLQLWDAISEAINAH